MEFLSFHNQLVAVFPPHGEDDDLLRRCFGLMLEPGKDCRLQEASLTSPQGSKLSFAVLGERDLVRHLGHQGYRRMRVLRRQGAGVPP